MAIFNLFDMTWEEAARLGKARALALLPVGATEAHGPHLPLGTDVLIAEAMARAGAARLAVRGLDVVVLPALAYSTARYAAGFAGTISIGPEVARAGVVDIARALAGHGFSRLVIANAHLEPAHIGALTEAVAAIEQEKLLEVVFPDVTRKPWALRLGDEFRSGACHAGQYEGSIVMAVRPDLVRDDIRAALPKNPVSLSQAIRQGQTTFEQAGGPRAYFGDPAAASAEEGRRTIEILGEILDEAVG